MNQRIMECLQDRTGHNILPFMWMKGETQDVIKKEIEKIFDAGIRAVCLESRPHPDFMGEKWWSDFDLILEECKKRGMRIWILDDSHFPTGLANGLLKEKYPERARKYLSVKTYDVSGPVTAGTLDLGSAVKKSISWMDLGKPMEMPLIDEQKIVAVHAHRLIRDDVISEDYIDFTGDAKDGSLRLDLPEGNWRILVIHTTYDEGAHPDYIHMIDPVSVSTLIEAVYEPHYAHYKDEFGKTIAGFFSDEPGFYNVFGFEFNEMVGRKMMPLPWTDELCGMLKEKLGDSCDAYLAYLWYPCEEGQHAADVRYAYMDAVTRLYEKHFSKQLGKWCSDHGVEYIGHVLEDNNVSTRLGAGAGHYFRAMSGQAMAGIDIIGDQIVPGRPNTARHGFNTLDGRFFHYVETKMGASAAHFQPEKGGRLMCEAFGAYGWRFGVRDMKWLADHLISRGVNYLVPHAFSMAQYPDVDCPPHFYAGGHNPEYPAFAKLMPYVARLAHLFEGGKWLPEVGILYRAGSEWAGDADLEEYIAEELHRAGIDYAIVPADALSDTERYQSCVADGKLVINGIPLKALIVPGAEWLDPKAVQFASEHPDVKIVIAGSEPAGVAGAYMAEGQLETEIPVVKVSELAEKVLEAGALRFPFTPDDGSGAYDASFYRYQSDEGEIRMIFNESLSHVLEGEMAMELPADNMRVFCYDAMKNRVMSVPQEVRDRTAYVKLKLMPYESAVLFAADEGTESFRGAKYTEKCDLSKDWEVSCAKAGDAPEYEPYAKMETLVPVSDTLPKFSGFMKYRKEVEIADPEKHYALECEHVYEVARVLVNGTEADFRICPPYRFDLTGAFKPGRNVIEIEAANTPARDVLNYDQAPFGHEKGVYEPSGMFGKVTLLCD